jgi:hypothetical protein
VILKEFVFYTAAEIALNSVDFGHTVENENYVNN